MSAESVIPWARAAVPTAYNSGVGFYFDPGEPPEDPDQQGTFREAMVITGIVLSLLAKPVAILLLGVGYLVFIFMMFAIHPLVGLSTIVVPLLLVAGYGVWEWRHPPGPPT